MVLRLLLGRAGVGTVLPPLLLLFLLTVETEGKGVSFEAVSEWPRNLGVYLLERSQSSRGPEKQKREKPENLTVQILSPAGHTELTGLGLCGGLRRRPRRRFHMHQQEAQAPNLRSKGCCLTLGAP